MERFISYVFIASQLFRNERTIFFTMFRMLIGKSRMMSQMIPASEFEGRLPAKCLFQLH